MSADNGSSNHSNAGGVDSSAAPAASVTIDSTNSPQPRAKINISLGGKKKKKSTTTKSTNNTNNLLSSKDGKSSLLAEEYSTIAEEAEIISQKRREEGTILVIPCAQGANEDEKRKHPLLASRLALLQKGTKDTATSDNLGSSDGIAQDIKDDTNTKGEEQTNNTANNDVDLEDEVVKQLIQSANQTQKDKEYNDGNTTPAGRGLVIAAPSKNNLITQQTTATMNEDEQFHQELAHHASDVDPTSSVYANVAIGDFGSALLRGMGWNGGDSNKKVNKTEETIKARPHRLGLGAAPLPLPSTTSGSSSKGGIHRRARRPDEVKRDEERQKQQEEAERRAAEKKRLDVQVTLQPGSVVYVRDNSDNASSKRARVVKTAGVPGLNRILVQMEDSTDDISVAKNSVKLCSWDELERMPFRETRSSKPIDRERANKPIDEEPRQNGSSSRRKRSRSYDSEDERRSRKETSRHNKRSDRDRYNERRHGRESSSDDNDDDSRDRKRRSKKHKRKKRHHRDRSYSRSRSRSRSPNHKRRHKHESHRKSSYHKSQSSDNQNEQHLNWLIPNIRVRLISKKIPAYYLQKGVVQDVTRTSQSSPKAVLLMDNGQVIDKVPERYLETALPKTGGKVIVLEGKHHWKKGRLLERGRDGYGVIQFSEDLEVVNISLDSIAEWCLNDDD